MSAGPQSQLELFEGLLRLSLETNDAEAKEEQSLTLQVKDPSSGKKMESIKIVL